MTHATDHEYKLLLMARQNYSQYFQGTFRTKAILILRLDGSLFTPPQLLSYRLFFLNIFNVLSALKGLPQFLLKCPLRNLVFNYYLQGYRKSK